MTPRGPDALKSSVLSWSGGWKAVSTTLAAQPHAPHRPGIPRHFDKPSVESSERTHGLHLTEPESHLWRERLAFRDALRGDPDQVAEYEALKLRLAHAHGADAAAYTSGKHAFVASVLATVGIQPGRR